MICRCFVALDVAAEPHHWDVVRFLVKEGKANGSDSKDGHDNCLHHAVCNDQLELVKILIDDAKFDPHVKGKEGRSCLHYAASAAMARFLIQECKVDIESKMDDGLTPLLSRVHFAFMGMFRCLVTEFKANVNAKSIDGNTALHLAADKGHLEIVRFLVQECKVNIDEANNAKQTALHLAMHNGCESVAKFLIEDGKANVEAKSADGSTCVHVAALKTRLSMLRYLVEDCKVNLSVVTESKLTPLHLACEKDSNLQVVKYLVNERKVDVEARNSEGETPFLVAAAHCNLRVLKTLVRVEFVVFSLHVYGFI